MIYRQPKDKLEIYYHQRLKETTLKLNRHKKLCTKCNINNVRLYDNERCEELNELYKENNLAKKLVERHNARKKYNF